MGLINLAFETKSFPFTFTKVGSHHDLTPTEEGLKEFALDLTGVECPKPNSAGPIRLPIKKGFDFYLTGAGVTAILGGTASGKSTLAEMFYVAASAAGVPATFIRFCEPEPDSILTVPELVAYLAEGLVGPESLIIVDSVRRIAFSGKGSTGKGGLSMGLFNDLTALSVIATKLNKSVVVVLNPLISDPQYEEAYQQALNGSVRSTIVCHSPGSVTYSTRDDRIHLTRTGGAYRFGAEEAARAKQIYWEQAEVSDFHPMTTTTSEENTELHLTVMRRAIEHSNSLPALLTGALLGDEDDEQN